MEADFSTGGTTRHGRTSYPKRKLGLKPVITTQALDSYNKNQGGTAKKSKYESATHIKQEQQEQ